MLGLRLSAGGGSLMGSKTGRLIGSAGGIGIEIGSVTGTGSEAEGEIGDGIGVETVCLSQCWSWRSVGWNGR